MAEHQTSTSNRDSVESDLKVAGLIFIGLAEIVKHSSHRAHSYVERKRTANRG
jgi:hypothetical protein